MNESVLSVWCDARKARRHGLIAIQARQRTRLSDAIAFARARSPYHRRLGDRPRVTLQNVRMFVEDPDRVDPLL